MKSPQELFASSSLSSVLLSPGVPFLSSFGDIYIFMHSYDILIFICDIFLSTSSSEARTSGDHFFYLSFFFFFFLSPDFHELWYSGMSTCHITEVKKQWAMLVLGCITASVHYSCL